MKDIETTIFDEPSGGIIAILTAFLSINGKSRRVAHALVFVNRAPVITLTVPRTGTLEVLAQVNALLPRFEADFVTWLRPTGQKGCDRVRGCAIPR